MYICVCMCIYIYIYILRAYMPKAYETLRRPQASAFCCGKDLSKPPVQIPTSMIQCPSSTAT